MRFDPHFARHSAATLRHTAPAGGPVAALTKQWPPRTRHPAARLLRAVLRLAGPQAELLRHAERPWASITFSGTRHSIMLQFNGAQSVMAGEAFIAALPEHEFHITGQLVADAAITSVVHDALAGDPPAPRLVVEAELLLLEEC